MAITQFHKFSATYLKYTNQFRILKFVYLQMKMFNLTKLIKLANQQVQAGWLNRNLNSKISVMKEKKNIC